MFPFAFAGRPEEIGGKIFLSSEEEVICEIQAGFLVYTRQCVFHIILEYFKVLVQK